MMKCNCDSDFMSAPLSDKSFFCNTANAVADNTILARIYTPAQVPGELFSLCEALKKGTVYPELYQPYSCKKNCCATGADGEEIIPGSEISSGNAEGCGCEKAYVKEGCKNDLCK